MSAIVGCILKENKNVAPILFECISKLEYRGYDSVGFATSDDVIYVKKSKGKIEEVNRNLNLNNLPGRYGISHLRWATLGEPSNENAHPHLDESHTVAIVHNGHVENYEELKSELINEGFTFTSTTDSEVIVHLIKKYMDENLDLEHALRKTAAKLVGGYAIAAISKSEPDRIVAIKKDFPMIVGHGKEGYFISSDIPAIIDYTRNIMKLEDGEIAILDKDGILIRDEDGKDKDLKFEYIGGDFEVESFKGFDHFMMKEIYEQPRAMADTLKQWSLIQNIFENIGEIKRICFVGGGSSYNASLTGKYLIESLANIPTEVINSSEYKYASKTWDKDTLVILLSSSGETPDSVLALRKAKETSNTIAIINVLKSTMANEAEYVIQTLAGPEIAIGATKTYISQLTVIYLIAGILARNNDFIKKLYYIPEYIDEILNETELIEELTEKYEFENEALIVGNGFAYPASLEGSLKLIEVAGIFAIGCTGGELKQKNFGLINNRVPVIALVTPGNDYFKTMNNLYEIKRFKGHIVSIGAKNDDNLKDVSDSVIEINPEVTDIFAPLVYVVVLQLLTYYVALKKGYDPDKPRHRQIVFVP